MNIAKDDQTPFLEFPRETLQQHHHFSQGCVNGEDCWTTLCIQVREACETHGFFLLKCEDIPQSLLQDMLTQMVALFVLPEGTKKKYRCPDKPYRSYSSNDPIVPLHESFGIDDTVFLDTVLDFTQLMWPQGNPSFSETLHCMSTKLLELNLMILRMIFQSFSISDHVYRAHIQDISSVLRLMKYRVPPPLNHDDHCSSSISVSASSSTCAIGMVAHTDKNALTILSQNDVQGLEFLSRDGKRWVQLSVPQEAFIVVVGDALKAWSNGRLHAVKHRVVMRGERERYSYGLFSFPKEGATIEVPHQLVDQDHPLRYRPFKFSDFVSYFASNTSDDALEVYAGA